MWKNYFLCENFRLSAGLHLTQHGDTVVHFTPGIKMFVFLSE